jgi:hypothetical protein
MITEVGKLDNNSSWVMTAVAAKGYRLLTI